MTIGKSIVTAAAIATIISTFIAVYSVFKAEDGIAQDVVKKSNSNTEANIANPEISIKKTETTDISKNKNGNNIECSPNQGHNSTTICGDVKATNGDINIGNTRD